MRILPFLAAIAIAVPAAAQDREVPYWASIKAERLNMRAGPGRDYPIRWVYHRAGLPLKIIRVHEGWRLVRDPDGDEGWVTANLLRKERGALVVGKGLAAIRDKPIDGARSTGMPSPGWSPRWASATTDGAAVDVGGPCRATCGRTGCGEPGEP